MAERGVLLMFLIALLANTWSSSVGQDCTSQIECGLCISIAGCAWCSEENFVGVRCQTAANISTSCPLVSIENPESSSPISVPSSSSDPLSLSEVRVQLRPGDPISFEVNVTALRNLPLDLYILIDLSASMNEELMTIQTVSSQLAGRIASITNNVTLGFGSFNDKPILPFARETIDNVCPQEVNDFCPSYAFRHTVTLTPNTTAFSEQVNTVLLTSNVDRAENGLEGLAQVITCEEIIGWRERVNNVGTRVVLFMTDEEFHFAGEGRLAGILNPYNGDCLLDPVKAPSGFVEYTRFNEFDYPSVGQILNLSRSFDVTTIFAIQEDHINSYFRLRDILNSDSIRAVVAPFTVRANSNATEQILSLIEDQYRRILQGINLVNDVNDVTNDIDLSIQYQPTCPPGSTPENTGCDNVPLDATVMYTVTATLNSCEGLNHGDTVRQRIAAPSFGFFDLVYTAVCNCECAVNPTTTPTSNCTGNGDPLCGVCECSPGRCGSDCSQFIGNRTSTDCPRGGVNNETCSGSTRGTCDCTCNCIQPANPQMISGDACQCDNFRCVPLDDQGRVCNGRGMCCEGNCMCGQKMRNGIELGRYRGEEGQVNLCQCEPEEEVCRRNGTLCSGRGTCGCNFCNCDSPTLRGTFCDLSNDQSCDFMDDHSCISMCRKMFNDDLPDNCTICNENRPLLFINDSQRFDLNSAELRSFLEDITNDRLSQTSGELGGFVFLTDQCDFTSGCTTQYYILGNETNLAIVAVREEICPPGGIQLPFHVAILAPIIIGCLLILGILFLILIKIIFLILDYAEVKKWQRDAHEADFSKNQNPLYQSPEMKYENVAYGRE